MKFAIYATAAREFASLPTWERGLKSFRRDPCRNVGRSLPTWERGLKFDPHKLVPFETIVAPYMGAWIEIETERAEQQDEAGSLPTWERGLKSSTQHLLYNVIQSLPTWERGLKSTAAVGAVGVPVSLPTWERGLK